MGRYLLRRKALTYPGRFVVLMAAAIALGSPATVPASDVTTGDETRASSPGIPIPDHPLVEREIELLSTPAGQKWIRDALERGLPFRGFILERIGMMGLPEELLYLPVVESAYRVDAVSRSGAAGLWQFMLNSIGPYNIAVDEWLDERHDFWKSTDAALRKLGENYRVLGDWHLAVAAYNCGLGMMQRTIAATGIRDFFLLAEQGHLPPQTARYVPKLLAVARMAPSAVPEAPGASRDPETQWVRLPTDRPVRLDFLAEAAGMPRELLATANAELRRGITPPSGTHLIKVPAAYRDAAERILAEKDRPLVPTAVHVVRSGDTLYGISRRYGAPLEAILRFNPSLHPDRLAPGDAVTVPVPEGPVPLQEETPIPPLEARYTVRPGDTLWGIARKFDTAMESLAAGNGLSPSGVIRPGMVLRVPRSSAETDAEEFLR